MSTKDLALTVIAGGRLSAASSRCRSENRALAAITRAILTRRSLPAWFRACHDPFAPRPDAARRS
jgi:hypothetical protein